MRQECRARICLDVHARKFAPQAAAAPAAMEEEEDEGDVDETGVEPKDVELVMTQVRFCYFQPVGNLGTLHVLQPVRGVAGAARSGRAMQQQQQQ